MLTNFRHSALAAVLLGSLALSACGSSGDTVVAENESAESVAAKIAKSDIRPSAGRWESKMTITKMDIPGLPPEVKGMMQKQMGKMQTSVSCLTKEEAEKPKADFFKPGSESGCVYDKFAMGDGKIAAVMTCEQNGQKQTMEMNGTYGEDAYTMDMTADGEFAPGKPMSMAMKVESNRVGDCTGDE